MQTQRVNAVVLPFTHRIILALGCEMFRETATGSWSTWPRPQKATCETWTLSRAGPLHTECGSVSQPGSCSHAHMGRQLFIQGQPRSTEEPHSCQSAWGQAKPPGPPGPALVFLSEQKIKAHLRKSHKSDHFSPLSSWS